MILGIRRLTIHIKKGYQGELTGQLGKFGRYEINYLCRPGFFVLNISDSSRTVHKFVQVVHVPTTCVTGGTVK